MGERARSFGAVAAAYERYRPGYPDALAEAVLAYANHPVRTALEIGAGTGKATRVFATRGVLVTATDPDPSMLAELRRHVDVPTVEAAFEELPVNTSYDLVFAGAALHWTQPAGRWERVAALLAPGGVFASFGGPTRLVDAALERAVLEARQAYLPDDEVPSPDGTPEDAAMQWPGTELLAGELFSDVRQERIERRAAWTAEQYVGLLGTVSAYLQLDPDDRAALFDRIRAVLPEQLEVDSGVTLHLARRC